MKQESKGPEFVTDELLLRIETAKAELAEYRKELERNGELHKDVRNDSRVMAILEKISE